MARWYRALLLLTATLCTLASAPGHTKTVDGHKLITDSVPLLSTPAPRRYRAVAIDQKPLDRQLFTQGLEIRDDKLYVSSGLYGRSALHIYQFDTMALLERYALPKRYFAEGLTLVGQQLYQLTWRSGDVLIYDLNPLRPKARAKITGQGWGITHHENTLFYSDGSATLYAIDLGNGGTQRSITVTDNGRPVRFLNELEWVDGKIWANVWQTDRIVIINPTSGQVEGNIQLSGLLPAQERRSDTDVLNGIARDPTNGDIWVTGKRWPWLYKIKLEESAP
jgi:glutamine cyclotransferase